MKTARFLVLLLLLAPMLLAADPIKGQFVGHWKFEGDDLGCDLTFREDGTFSGNIADKGKNSADFAGKWSLEGSDLYYEYTKSSLPGLPVGSLDRDKILEVTKDHFVVENRAGEKHRYQRVE